MLVWVLAKNAEMPEIRLAEREYSRIQNLEGWRREERKEKREKKCTKKRLGARLGEKNRASPLWVFRASGAKFRVWPNIGDIDY